MLLNGQVGAWDLFHLWVRSQTFTVMLRIRRTWKFVSAYFKFD